MAEDNEQRTCKHSACSCPVGDDDDYCSATCEGAGGTLQIDCDCGHAECTGDF